MLPEYFKDILDGKKKYELHLNDFDVSEGDVMILEEYTIADPEARKPTDRKGRPSYAAPPKSHTKSTRCSIRENKDVLRPLHQEEFHFAIVSDGTPHAIVK